MVNIPVPDIVRPRRVQCLDHSLLRGYERVGGKHIIGKPAKRAKSSWTCFIRHRWVENHWFALNVHLQLPFIALELEKNKTKTFLGFLERIIPFHAVVAVVMFFGMFRVFSD